MNESFDLWDEPWVLVQNTNCETREVSLLDALLHAHEYSSLAGESPAQDAAVLRLLIAVVHTVFYRVNEDGEEALLRDEDEALDRWAEIWNRKAFPEEPIRAYRERWRERFDLLDAERPFYQVLEAKIGTPHSAAKLNGAILQSENKLRIFANRTEATSGSLFFAEAARWLVYLQGFDDASVKPKTAEGKRNVKTKPGSVRAWLGNLGVLYAVGENLFETVWLNSVFLRDGGELYDEPKPSWELPAARIGEYTQLPMPDNLAELFTLQSRRLLLKRAGERIVEYAEYCGDLLDTQNAFAEPMTVWKPIKKKAETIGYSPRTHSPYRQLWRDFSAVAVRIDKNRLPGITNWLSNLQNENCLGSKPYFRFAAVSALYDSSGSSVTNTVSDTLSFHADLLTQAGAVWQQRIEGEVQYCDALAEAVGQLAGKLAIAAGRRELKDGAQLHPEEMSVAEAAKTQFYFRIDAAFRDWLLKPVAGQSGDEREKLCDEWRNTARTIALAQGHEMVNEAGEAAFIGRTAETGKGKSIREAHYSSAEAFNRFHYRINKA